MPRDRLGRRRLPGLPVAVRRRRRVHRARAASTLGQFGPIKDHMRAIRDISDVLNDGSGVVVHEVVADGSVWHGKARTRRDPTTGELVPDFNTDEIVKFPGAVALIWRWTGDDGFRDEMLDFTRRNLEYVRDAARRRRRRLAGGQRQRRAAGHGRGEARQRRLLHPRAVRLRRHGAVGGSGGGRRRGRGRAPTRSPARFEDDVVDRGGAAVRGLAPRPAATCSQPEALDRRRPDGGRAVRRRRVRPRPGGVRRTARAALATRENNCYSGERPGNRGLFHTGCGGGPDGHGRVRDLLARTPAIQAVGEGNYGRLGADAAAALHRRQRRDAVLPAGDRRARPTSSRARCRRSCPSFDARRRRRHAAEHRPLLDLPLDVHAGLGPLRHGLAGGAPAARRAAAPRPRLRSRSCRRCPTGSRACRAPTSASAAARPTCSPPTTATRYTTTTDTSDAPVADVPHRAHAAARLDGRVGDARRRAGAPTRRA